MLEQSVQREQSPILELRKVDKRRDFAHSSSLAFAISSALLTGVVMAEDNAVMLDKLEVEEEVIPDTNPYAEPGAPYLGKYSADPRRTRPLAETPQTINVLTQEEIQDTGRSDLRDILDGQAGITVGTGENGNAFGDRYIIRGHEARSDVFVDGLRDPGMTIRESFAVDQVEVTKGPSSTFAGRGTTGGAVNSATKQASTEYDFTKLSGGLGTDSYHRGTVDINKVLNYDTAVRVNLLHAEEDVPDRDPADRSRVGAALSGTYHATDKLKITADYYHLDAEDKPDLGSYIDRTTGTVAKDVPVYTQDEDFLESEVNTGTLRVGYEVTPKVRVVNLTRYGTTDNGYVATGTSGSTAYATEEDATAGVNGYSSASLSTHQGWQEVEYFANQLNLFAKTELGGLNHEFVFGLEYSKHSVLNGVYSNSATGASNCYVNGRGGITQGYCIVDQNGNTVGGINSLMQRELSRGSWDSDWNINTVSVSMMDTVDLTERWTAFGGIRYDYFDYDTLTQSGGTITPYQYSDGLWNGHVGVTYDVLPNANVYASFSTASNINGGESDVGSSCGYGGICANDSSDELGTPENTQSWELGTKWQLMDNRLLATAAVFRINKDDVMEQLSNDSSYEAIGTLNTGKNRVEGVEFGLSGNITDKLSAQMGIALMNAKVLDSNTASNIGKTLANFADKSASVHLKYQLTPKFAFGGTMTYEGERYTGQPDSAANEAMVVPDYVVFDMFANYQITQRFKARLNIGNVTDKDYYLAAYRSGAFTYMGDRRNAQLTFMYDF